VAEFPVNIGLIGCGNISGIYLKNARRFDAIEVVACADVLMERAEETAAEFGVPQACSVDALLADPAIEIVLNLTTPQAHADVALAALAAGKSVYNEKPLAIRLEDGRRILETARSKGLRVGCAPDTFLGGAWQTARKLIDDGAIGAPVAATAFMLCHGHEHWHPDPEFLYRVGGGPLFDMGPYYLTALVNLLGPVRRVCASARTTFPQRTITSEPKRGQTIDVETPTHVAGVLDFDSGVIGTLVTSFDVWHANVPFIEIYGSTGSLSLPDPNAFGGVLWLGGAGDKIWRDVPPAFACVENDRGLGIADMALALRHRRPHRASGELGLHVLEVMHGLLGAAHAGRRVEVATGCERPAAVAVGPWPDELGG
jgi:predicted dehydrogenase